MTRPRAAVDSGTNTTRLLVVDADGEQLVRRSVITRLGRGVDAAGALDPEALQRTLDVIGRYRDEWTALGVAPGDVQIVATSAVRDAADRDRYFSAVRELTGVPARVLSGDEEARLSYAGASGAVAAVAPILVIDIGGGSTELIVGDADGHVIAAHSMQVGAVRVTERHLRRDPPPGAEVDAARHMVALALDTAEGVLAIAGGALTLVADVVGVAGTVATIGALHAGIDTPDDPRVHGVRVGAGDVADWAARLLSMTAAERATLPGVPEGRADVIAAGALVLEAVMARAGADEVVVSLADILDGLVAATA